MSTLRPAGLSKSRFCSGLQCTKQLWLRVHESGTPELQVDASREAIFERGHRVGEAARERFPGGVLIGDDPWQVKHKIEATRMAMAEGAPAIFEAAFEADGVFVAIDILSRGRRGYVLDEVKSTLDVKPPHVPEVAIQLHVLRKAGVDVRRTNVMHLNRECRHPDLSNLFVRDDITHEAEALLRGIPGDIRRFQDVLSGPMPNVAPGDQCADPYECAFTSRCIPALPEHHVTTLYRIGKRATRLVETGFETIHDLPEDVDLPAVAARQARAVRTGRTVVEPGLADALQAIGAPAAFLDFESINPAIPVWPGCHPYEQVPVQMSCHVRSARGRLEHHEFLADGPADPRAAIAEAIVRACSDARTVVAYNASFEKRCIEHLAEAVPFLGAALREVAGHLVDLLPIVRDHLYHPDFGGSFSQKAVLPALVPSLGYGDLAIADGQTASSVLEAMLLGDEGASPDRERLRGYLLRYCARDTEGMVRIYEAMRRMCDD